MRVSVSFHSFFVSFVLFVLKDLTLMPLVFRRNGALGFGRMSGHAPRGSDGQCLA